MRAGLLSTFLVGVSQKDIFREDYTGAAPLFTHEKGTQTGLISLFGKDFGEVW